MLIKILLLHLKQVCFDVVQGWQSGGGGGGGGGTGAPTCCFIIIIIIRTPFTELVYRSRLPLYEIVL